MSVWMFYAWMELEKVGFVVVVVIKCVFECIECTSHNQINNKIAYRYSIIYG